MWLFKRRNFWTILIIDIVLLGLCYYSAYWLRYDGEFNAAIREQILETVLPLLCCKLACFVVFDLYRGMWRYAGIKDLVNVIKATISGSILFIIYLAMVYHFQGFSRSILLADAIFTIVAIGGVRLGIRIYYQEDPGFMDEVLFWRKAGSERQKVLIVGTGMLAERLYRELSGTSELKYNVVGFIDDQLHHKGMKIHGVPIVGTLSDIADMVDRFAVFDILFAVSGMETAKIKTVIESCAGKGVRFKVIPSFAEWLQGDVTQQLRDIHVEDLLERDAVHIDMAVVRSELQGKRVLVTGAGGSIGSELARQILGYQPSHLILLDNAETPLYRIDMELRTRKTTTVIIPCIGDIRTFKGLDRIFRQYKPQYVYHAAAYKHVPLMELTPLDAVNNNIIGTYKLASVSCKHHVDKFVMISTDKAVRPTSVMGATKRVAEMVVQDMSGNGTRFAVVRFGNVLGSNGSVVPLFEKQIASGGPVTVTHPEMTRYFMTIPEAVMLVLQAGAIGTGGELFLLDMGEPVKILDLARNMIRLAGLAPDRDIGIEFIGLRPGEKLYEELLIEGEGVVDTAYDKIKICRTGDGIDEDGLYRAIEAFNLMVKDARDQDAALLILSKIVPEYRSPEHVRVEYDRVENVTKGKIAVGDSCGYRDMKI